MRTQQIDRAMCQRSWLARLGWAYTLLIVLWLLLRWLFFDALWWLALVNTVAEYLFLPLPALLAAGLWRRSWRLLLGLSLPAIAFGALFGALFLPKLPDRPAEHARVLTVMTFNVLTTNKDAAAIVGAIRAANPDVVGFQELTRARKAAISAALAADYPYHRCISRCTRSCGSTAPDSTSLSSTCRLTASAEIRSASTPPWPRSATHSDEQRSRGWSRSSVPCASRRSCCVIAT